MFQLELLKLNLFHIYLFFSFHFHHDLLEVCAHLRISDAYTIDLALCHASTESKLNRVGHQGRAARETEVSAAVVVAILNNVLALVAQGVKGLGFPAAATETNCYHLAVVVALGLHLVTEAGVSHNFDASAVNGFDQVSVAIAQVGLRIGTSGRSSGQAPASGTAPATA